MKPWRRIIGKHMLKVSSVFFPLLLYSFITSCAPLSTKYEQYIGRAIFDIPNTYKPDEVVDGIYNAIAWRSSNLQKFQKLFPDELPDKPGVPKMGSKEVGLGVYSIQFATVDCGENVWVSMTGQENELRSPYGTTDAGIYKVCIYPYKDGYRVYIFGIYTYSESTSIGGIIASGIKKVVMSGLCQGDSVYNCWFEQIVDRVKKKFSDAQLVKLDLPQPKSN